MNPDYRDDNSCCYFHPTEVVVGICPLCLNERLLILSAKHHHHHHYHHHHQYKKATTIHLPKIFAFGSLLHRLEFKQSFNNNNNNNNKKSHSTFSDNASSSTDQEDSFISIKFEDNGVASWDKGTVSKVSLDHCSVSWKTKLQKVDQVNNNNINTTSTTIKQGQTTKTTVIEHVKPRTSLRWRKRIGHLFQVVRWKRSTKSNSCHVSNKVEGVKIRHKGWIKTLTKRRTKE